MVDYVNTILAKKETTYATDAAPTPALNAVLTRNAKITPLVVDLLDRNLDLPSRGTTPGVPTNERVLLSYEIELQSSGAAGTAAPWMVNNEACGMAPAVLTATVKADQKMAAFGASISSLTQWGYVNDQLFKAVGSRGDLSGIDFTAGQFPFLSYDYMGIVPTGTVGSVSALSGAVFTAYKDPLEVNITNTSYSLDGFAAVLRSFKAKANAAPKLRNLVGARYIQRPNHAMDCTIVVELPSVAAKNYFSTLRAGSRVAQSIVHGTAAGFIVQVDTANLQMTGIDFSNEDDIVMATITGRLTITSAGQDDILITAK